MITFCENLTEISAILTSDIRHQTFYQNIDPDYTIVEDHINFLLRDRTLKETTQGLSLTTKGWFLLTNSDRVGYVAQRIENVRKEQIGARNASAVQVDHRSRRFRPYGIVNLQSNRPGIILIL